MPKPIELRARRKELDRRRGRAQRTGLRLETLEARMLMTANAADPSQFTLSHGSGVCHCPICTGVGLDQIPAYEAAATVGGYSSAGYAASNPLSALPALSSRPTATAKIYLDFNGHTEAFWGEFSNVVTPVYDVDGDRTTFSAAELSNIQQIWARVAEDYAPFNVDVTTIDPGNFANKVAVRVAIGGNYSDWFGEGAGGVAYIGGFYNSASNVAYVFEDALGNGNARYVAEAASHEAGHTFGLQHQSLWSGNTLVDPYYEGDANWAPIMGVGYYSARTTWHNGPTSNGPTSYQDDLAILANSNNGFGYRADDWGNTAGAASALVGANISTTGVIERVGDVDMFSFTTSGGAVNLALNVAQFGANLDAELRLQRADGTVVASADPTNSLSASISTTLSAGTYYVVARGSSTTAHAYGNLGQYTLTGTLPASVATAPEIDVTVGGVAVADGGAYSFGSTTAGAPVSRQVTITNSGNQVLALMPIAAPEVPAGFSLASNINIYALNPGASYTFTVVLNAATAGNYSGVLTIANNDLNESPYQLVLSGTVTAPITAPEIDVTVGGVAVADGGAYSFGSTTAGTPVSRQVTITNSGNQVLALMPIAPAEVPAGFSLASNINIYALNPGDSYTFTVVLNAAAAGNYSGVLTIANNDLNESPYQLVLSGTVTAPITAPEIDVTVGGVAVADGGAYSFGSTTAGTPVSRQVTITNSGNQVLALMPIAPAEVPAGFSLASNINIYALNPGASYTFTVVLNAAAAGNYSGVLTIANNDLNESPYQLVLSGAVAPAPQTAIVRTIDNGEAGFSTVGPWYRQTGIGRDGDIHFAFRGNGSAAATWNFTGLPAGTYRVYASYPAHRNYASNAPFSVYNGNALLGTRIVNQEISAPTVIDGARYQLLGTYTITGSQLMVRLTNAANQNVVADSIRIEQVAASGGRFARGATVDGSAAIGAAVADIVHVESNRRGEAPVSRNATDPASTALSGRLQTVSQRLAAMTTRLQTAVNLRTVDHLHSQDGVGPIGAGGTESSRTSDLDWLLAGDFDWLTLK